MASRDDVLLRSYKDHHMNVKLFHAKKAAANKLSNSLQKLCIWLMLGLIK